MFMKSRSWQEWLAWVFMFERSRSNRIFRKKGCWVVRIFKDNVEIEVKKVMG